ncbi:cyclase family protein [Aquella oligotrophica]|uniref:Uncharacterized protein n=1 Tax=Aquella oligotrophica TaxID=2067065 RepID=A0A2I7N926_9NEIS|nr:hypothetical protein CUN60_11855 [Aquella oligotrophica]
MNTTLHLSTHTDAPSHFLAEGKSIDLVDLDKYIGRCQTVEVNLTKADNGLIQPHHLPEAPRILFSTSSFNYQQPFNPNFVTFGHETCKLLL